MVGGTSLSRLIREKAKENGIDFPEGVTLRIRSNDQRSNLTNAKAAILAGKYPCITILNEVAKACEGVIIPANKESLALPKQTCSNIVTRSRSRFPAEGEDEDRDEEDDEDDDEEGIEDPLTDVFKIALCSQCKADPGKILLAIINAADEYDQWKMYTHGRTLCLIDEENDEVFKLTRKDARTILDGLDDISGDLAWKSNHFTGDRFDTAIEFLRSEGNEKLRDLINDAELPIMEIQDDADGTDAQDDDADTDDDTDADDDADNTDDDYTSD